jgi:hypothetical protein
MGVIGGIVAVSRTAAGGARKELRNPNIALRYRGTIFKTGEEAVSTLCKTYSDERDARAAVERLLASGAPRRGIRLLTGSRLHDVRDERVGTYAGAIGPDAPVGRFAGRPRRRCQGTGSFAGDPDRQRKGSFADVERDMIITFERRGEHPRVATHRALSRLLSSVTLAGERPDHLVEELHDGHRLVVAEVDPPAA